MKDNWCLTEIDEQIITGLTETLKIHPVMARLLYSRNIHEPYDAVRFLNPSISQLHSPFLMKDMYDAVSLLKEAVTARKKIGIFCDSDLDGLTSLTVVNTLFKKIGLDIFYYYPNSENSDYGLTPPVTRIFCDEKIDLLLTLDCGVRDIEEIRRFRDQGIDVIVCDHHEQDSELPDCLVINPKQHDCSYPFKELAGVGVAFKLVQAFMYSYLPLYQKKCNVLVKDGDRFDLVTVLDGIVISEEKSVFYYPEELGQFSETELPLFHYNVSPEEAEKTGSTTCESIESLISPAGTEHLKKRNNTADMGAYYPSLMDGVLDVFHEISFFLPEKCNSLFRTILPYVAIGTVADVVSVSDENRVLITRGIDYFNNTDEPTLERLKTHVKREIDSYVIGWQIAPLLNSPGRFGQTELTANFITGTDYSDSLFDSINSLNEYRKEYVAELLQKITASVVVEDEKIVFIKDFEIVEGVTGLLAGRLNDYYNRPVIVASPVDDNIYKGSGRSNSVPLFQYVEEYSDLFLRFGGHQQAFGFTIDRKNIEVFEQLMSKIGESIVAEEKVYEVDMELDYKHVTSKLVNSISRMGPFGISNNAPLLLSRSVPVESVSAFGKKKEHGKICTDVSNLEIIGWRMAEKMINAAQKGVVDVLFNPEIHTFYGKQRVRMMVCDID